MNEVKVSDGGRVVVPADLRQKYGIQVGDVVLWQEDEEGLRLVSRRDGIRRAQRILAKCRRPGSDIVDELSRDRREEAAGE